MDDNRKKLLGDTLAKLNKEDAAHWTKDGLPNLNVVKELAKTTFKRGEVNEAFPDVKIEVATDEKQNNANQSDGKSNQGDKAEKGAEGNQSSEASEDVGGLGILDELTALASKLGDEKYRRNSPLMQIRQQIQVNFKSIEEWQKRIAVRLEKDVK